MPCLLSQPGYVCDRRSLPSCQRAGLSFLSFDQILITSASCFIFCSNFLVFIAFSVPISVPHLMLPALTAVHSRRHSPANELQRSEVTAGIQSSHKKDKRKRMRGTNGAPALLPPQPHLRSQSFMSPFRRFALFSPRKHGLHRAGGRSEQEIALFWASETEAGRLPAPTRGPEDGSGTVMVCRRKNFPC